MKNLNLIKHNLERIADTVRTIALEAVELAGSGHAGLPLGCAEIGAYLYGHYLVLHPDSIKWPNRDLVVLSAGHGSIWLYSFLYLMGYELTLEDLKQYRKMGSKTPSHPEFGKTMGIEATTGTDGQGIGFGVGQALALKILASKFNTVDFELFDNKVIVLAGDGCFMEGISSEVSSFAGHLGLNNLIVIYDSNKTCLDGLVSETFSENMHMRYQSYDWEVYEVNGHDFEELDSVLTSLKYKQTKPALIIANTLIGSGVQGIQGTPLAHSGPLGRDALNLIKNKLGITSDSFGIPEDVHEFFKEKMQSNKKSIDNWYQLFNQWAKIYPEKAAEYDAMLGGPFSSQDICKQLVNLAIPQKISGRNASHFLVNTLAQFIPSLYGGSADLARSDGTYLNAFDVIQKNKFLGRNIKYGVREFGMASIASGMSLTGFFKPFVGTFLAFYPYMANAVRITAMMKIQVIYQFTHDSFLIGEDGPTHQPIEQISTLRAIPNLRVIRPADFYEIGFAWAAALSYLGPTALILSRQEMPTLLNDSISYEESLGKGAYILKKENGFLPQVILIATGSEVSLALDIAHFLQMLDLKVRVISMPCWELFEEQSERYKNDILCANDKILRVSIEAGVSQGWHRYIGSDGLAISIEHFGETGSSLELRKKFGFTTESIVDKIKHKLRLGSYEFQSIF